jgi:pectin methylesterase-like acyl-CoA thioesterase
MTWKVIKLTVVLCLLTGCACYAIQDSNAPWQPDVKLSGLTKLFETGKTRQIIVSADGHADFNSIQEAIDSVGKDNKERVVVLIKPGFYKQRALIPKNKPFITLRGTDPYKTIIS